MGRIKWKRIYHNELFTGIYVSSCGRFNIESMVFELPIRSVVWMLYEVGKRNEYTGCCTFAEAKGLANEWAQESK